MVKRLYHFLGAEFALDDIKHKRLKIAQIANLNDPFDLRAPQLNTRAERQAWDQWRSHMNRDFGMLCFSPHWKNLTMWSHYADKHKGISLGFDVAEEIVTPVHYQQVRPTIDLSRRPSEADLQPLLFLKSEDWGYEEEWRVWTRLEQPTSAKGQNLFFHDFGEDLKLVEVVLGAMCEKTHADLKPLISDYDYPVDLFRAQLAFQTFDVTKQKLGL